MGDQVAWITGAGSGIGKATALLFGRSGHRVAVTDLRPDDVTRTVEEIRKAGGEALDVTADVSSPQAMESAVKQIIDKYGRLDAVFANAGINGVWAPLEELTPEDWDKTIRTNLTGTFLTVKYAVPHLKVRGGSVVICSSINGTRIFSNTGASAYSTSKAGQVAFGKMIALELAKHRVRVNMVCPGAVDTNIEQRTEHRDTEREKETVEYKDGAEIPLTRGQSAEPDQIAEVVLFLASEKAAYITGTEIWVDGGTSLVMG